VTDAPGIKGRAGGQIRTIGRSHRQLEPKVRSNSRTKRAFEPSVSSDVIWGARRAVVSSRRRHPDVRAEDDEPFHRSGTVHRPAWGGQAGGSVSVPTPSGSKESTRGKGPANQFSACHENSIDSSFSGGGNSRAIHGHSQNEHPLKHAVRCTRRDRHTPRSLEREACSRGCTQRPLRRASPLGLLPAGSAAGFPGRNAALHWSGPCGFSSDTEGMNCRMVTRTLRGFRRSTAACHT
jgi:hypothetical protein